VVQYRGTNFVGWQKQNNENTKRSIQTLLEVCVYEILPDFHQNALQILGRHECEVVTAGRTDAGVHAYANCAHVDILRRNKRTNEIVQLLYPLANLQMEPFSALTVKKATNFYLQRHTNDIYISKVEAVKLVYQLESNLICEDFHARFDCTARTYVYRILQSKDLSGLPFLSDLYHFYNKELSIENMRVRISPIFSSSLGGFIPLCGYFGLFGLFKFYSWGMFPSLDF
jgi:tRNA pseudouridine38-40 synthase